MTHSGHTLVPHPTGKEWESLLCGFNRFSSVKFSRSVVSDSLQPQASLSITNSPSFLKLMSIESVVPSSHLILCHPLLLLPSISPSFRVLSNESVLCIRWSKYWSFSFSFSPYNEYSGLISFRIDWFDFLAVQGTLKSFLQHHCSKASILKHSAFFMVQLSHTYMTTGTTIALTITDLCQQNGFVSKTGPINWIALLAPLYTYGDRDQKS